MRRAATLLTCLSLLAIPSAAIGEGSSECEAYNSQVSQLCGSPTVAQVTAPRPPTAPRATTTLPFTGLDVGLLAAAGATFLAAGLVVRRLSAGPAK